jgi:hypothetical protein
MSDATLAARIERLERVARRDRVLALGALVLALATAQSPSPSGAPLRVRDARGAATITANGIAFVDATNVTRLDMGFDGDRYPAVDLYDSAGTIRQSMYLLRDRPVLRQFDKAGHRRAEMFLGSDTQNGEFVIRDDADVTRAAVFIGTKGLPEFAVYGSDANVRAYLATDDDAPYLVMKDRSATSRLVMGAYESGKIGMDVRDASGAAVWSKP